MSATTNLRTVDLPTLASALTDRRTRALDLVAPASRIAVTGGRFLVAGMEPILGDDGVTDPNGAYEPTRVGDEGVAEKLGIPVAYLRRMRDTATDLYDANVNGWLNRDERSFLMRLLMNTSGDGGPGVLRAFLSDSYRTIDDYDVLLAALEGMQTAGVEAPEIVADLTDRRMYVRVTVPAIAVHAEALLKNYRSPFGGDGPDLGRGWTPARMAEHNAAIAGRTRHGHAPTDPVVFAGFVLTNSEVGGGALRITPRLVVQICDNGMTITADATREIHLGAKLQAGIVKVSDATIAANLRLVRSQTADAVSTFLDAGYVAAKVAELEKAAGAKVADPVATITAVGKTLGFTQDQAAAILSHFVAGGQPTAGGILQAVTSVAQTMEDGDAAYALESAAVRAMTLAASAR